MHRNKTRWTTFVVLGMVMGGLLPPLVQAEAGPGGPAAEAAPAVSGPAVLGVSFVEGSTSTVIIERDGKRYLVDLASRTIVEAAPTQAASSAATAASVPEATTLRPAESKPQQATAQARAKKPGVYEPGDDFVFTLPTGRRLDRHGLHVNFNHRFAFEPAFKGPAKGSTLLGLDNFSISSFGFRYGVTDKFSVSVYRSPSTIARPLEFMAAYNFLDEQDGHPFNAAIRFSVDGHDNFTKNYTYNFEGIFSRSLTSRAQIYIVPTGSINNRRIFLPLYPNPIPEVPAVDTFSLGAALAVDIRPTVAVVAEVIPTLVGYRSLGIHRPAYSFGIQKKIWRHAFTFGFTNGPGTTVAQRGATRASYLGDPTADTPSGLFVAFDLTRQFR